MTVHHLTLSLQIALFRKPQSEARVTTAPHTTSEERLHG